MTAAAMKPLKTSTMTLETNTHKWRIATSQDPNSCTGTVTISLAPGPGSDMDSLDSRVAAIREVTVRLHDITRDPKATDKMIDRMDGTTFDGATFETPFAASANFARSVEMALQPLGEIQSAGAVRA
ncbi:MAG: hypothetical protein ACK502_10600 [Alphaproteobacteria bacterium]